MIELIEALNGATVSLAAMVLAGLTCTMLGLAMGIVYQRGEYRVARRDAYQKGVAYGRRHPFGSAGADRHAPEDCPDGWCRDVHEKAPTR